MLLFQHGNDLLQQRFVIKYKKLWRKINVDSQLYQVSSVGTCFHAFIGVCFQNNPDIYCLRLNHWCSRLIQFYKTFTGFENASMPYQATVQKTSTTARPGSMGYEIALHLQNMCRSEYPMLRHSDPASVLHYIPDKVVYCPVEKAGYTFMTLKISNNLPWMTKGAIGIHSTHWP